MSDRYPGQIRIGGELSRNVLQGLVTALSKDGASHDYGEPGIGPWHDTSEECLLGYLDGDLLHFKGDQLHNGEFEATELFCIEHGIPFDRDSDHYGESEAENVHWRPGMDRPTVLFADANAVETVCGSTVRLAMAAFEECRTSVPHTIKTERFEVGVKLLLIACPPLPPELESFQIVA